MEAPEPGREPHTPKVQMESNTNGERSDLKWRILIALLVLAALAAVVYKQAF